MKPASDVFGYGRDSLLRAIFAPKNVAVVGATERSGSVGRTLMWNLIRNPFGGAVFPINPKRPNVLGVKAYPSLADLPEPVDLAVIATPAPTVPNVIGECVAAGVKSAIIISAGFKEIGEEGARLERQILEQARRGKMRIVGPNCLGVMSPLTGLNATFAGSMARAGNVGFLSQSGALCTAVLDWSLRENVGFSAFVSLGSMLDVGWGDLITYLGDDPHTKSILIYMESVGDASAFLSAAREVALTKPIIVIKTGRSEAAAQAAATHTGLLTGSDEVLDAAFRRCGVLRVNSIAELFYMAEVLAKQSRPRGARLAILTNAGGPGVLATDALISEGGELAALSEETMESLEAALPPHWSHGNPIDILGDADAGRYVRALEAVAKDPNTDGLLVILTPQAMTDPTEVAEQLKNVAKRIELPVLASWMGGVQVIAGEAILNQAEIPTFAYPDTAARMFAYMWRYSSNLQSLYETPPLLSKPEERTPDRALAEQILSTARQSGRTVLTEWESKQLLSAYGIPTVETYIAASEKEAAARADDIGYPVVLKLHSETITHKTDVGGIQLNLQDEAAVRHAYQAIEISVSEKAGSRAFSGVTVQPMIPLDGYELIVGSTLDPQFGPVLLFGSGGQLVEVYRDLALGLPPLNATLARRMMEGTNVHIALKGVRGRPPVDLNALERLLVRFSHLVAEQSWVKEIDINPLLASPERLIALDARVVVHDAETPEEKLPTLAIRPYPIQYVASRSLSDGTPITIRPIRPEDEPLMVRFHGTLSERSVYQRYFHPISLDARITHERLTRICFIDYDREMALVAEHRGEHAGEHEILGVARLIKARGANEAEFGVLINDRFQGQGLGTMLLRSLVQVGRDEGLDRIIADILPDNHDMQRLCKRLGFHLYDNPEDGLVRAEIEL